jgi:hypothetical protein
MGFVLVEYVSYQRTEWLTLSGARAQEIGLNVLFVLRAKAVSV